MPRLAITVYFMDGVTHSFEFLGNAPVNRADFIVVKDKAGSVVRFNKQHIRMFTTQPWVEPPMGTREAE